MSREKIRTSERVFNFIVTFKRDHDGLAPTVKEIAEALVVSESTVKYHLLKLKGDNRIRTSRRGIEVSGGAWDLPDEE